ncbi:MAG TPA: methyltransferase domain-containing protein [Propionibacteriaceae bacterium]|nr:methyltransferase domain-containing protein [Propionibacteriaceae bacterium]
MTDSALDRPDVHALRDETCSLLAGRVVEVGFGSGLNVWHYPTAVTRVHAVEPLSAARALAGPRISASSVPVTFDGEDAQRLPFDDGSLDAALLTFTLCAIPDPAAATSELYRVLVPGGTVAFLEHGRSPDPGVRRWQRRLNGLNLRVDGCHLDRVAPELLHRAGFSVSVTREHYLARVPRFAGYLYQGSARKPAVPAD